VDCRNTDSRDRTAVRRSETVRPRTEPEGNIIFPLLNTPPFPQVVSFQNGSLANPSGGSAPAAGLVPDINSSIHI